MTRKDIENVGYKFTGSNKKLSLYYDYKYRGTISLDRGKARILYPDSSYRNDMFTSPEEMKTALETIAEGLLWDIDTYNPNMNDTYRVGIRIGEYLRGLGFKVVGVGNWGYTTYSKGIGTEQNILVNLHTDDDPTKNRIGTNFGNAIAQNNFMNEDDAVKLIDTYVKMHVLGTIGDSVELLNNVSSEDITNSDMFKLNYGSFSREDMSFKDVMINVLEDQLEKLKKL